MVDTIKKRYKTDNYPFNCFYRPFRYKMVDLSINIGIEMNEDTER